MDNTNENGRQKTTGIILGWTAKPSEIAALLAIEKSEKVAILRPLGKSANGSRRDSGQRILQVLLQAKGYEVSLIDQEENLKGLAWVNSIRQFRAKCDRLVVATATTEKGHFDIGGKIAMAISFSDDMVSPQDVALVNGDALVGAEAHAWAITEHGWAE